jgi:glycosyltransferase involved in cell wall biosynthesis
LDLLLEAFAGLEQHLWVVTPLEPAFRRAYRRELFELPNVHTSGYVQPRSARYYDTLRRCAWCILPSCSEGQAQSVVEALHAGLIPLVSRASGVDVADFGEWIEPVTVDAIRSCMAWAAHRPMDEIRRRSGLARGAARTVYAPEAFGRNFQAALEALFARRKAGKEFSGGPGR